MSSIDNFRFVVSCRKNVAQILQPKEGKKCDYLDDYPSKKKPNQRMIMYYYDKENDKLINLSDNATLSANRESIIPSGGKSVQKKNLKKIGRATVNDIIMLKRTTHKHIGGLYEKRTLEVRISS